VGWLSRFSPSLIANPKVGEGRRVFAIGDIHGRCDLLDALLQIIRDYAASAPPAQNVLVFLGDYVDRGLESRAVIERLCTLDWPDWQTVFLCGNHDKTVLDFLKNAAVYRAWRGFGAVETLLSYGVRPPLFNQAEDMERARRDFALVCPKAHMEFLSGLKYWHVEGDYAFVHAGVRPSRPLADQSLDDLIWIRDDFLNHRKPFEKIIVHGHTPVRAPVVLPNRIGLDTSAHGRLTALVLEGEKRLFLDTQKNSVEADGSGAEFAAV